MAPSAFFRSRTMSLIIIAALVLLVVACGAAATPTATPAPPAAPVAQAPTATAAPAAPAATTAPAAPAAATATAAAPAVPTATKAPAAVGVSFSKDLSPIFERSCSRCHAGISVRAGLDLSTYAATMKGGSGGPAVIAGDPDKSTLYTLVKSGVMPFGGSRLSESDTQKIYDWIKAGALNN